MEISMTDTINNQPAASEEPAKPSLNLADLVNVIHLISACNQRGAFKVEELSSIGGLYDRLYSFLDSTGALAKPEAAAPETAVPEETK
jgi:hypothetical protein